MLGYKVPLQVIEDYENKLKRAKEVVQPKNGSFNAFCDGVHDAFAEVRMCGLVNLDSNWHTGTPPMEKGTYLIRQDCLYAPHIVCERKRDGESLFIEGSNQIIEDGILAYQKIEPFKEASK